MERGHGILVSFLVYIPVFAFLVATPGPSDIPDNASRNDLLNHLYTDIGILVASGELAGPEQVLMRQEWWSLRSDPPLKTAAELLESDGNAMNFPGIKNAEDKKKLVKIMGDMLKPPAGRQYIPLALSPDDAYDLYRLGCLRKTFASIGRKSRALEMLIERAKSEVLSKVPA